MSDRYTIEKLDIKKHGNGLWNLWQTVSSKYPGGVYWYHGDTNKQWENVFVCLDGDKLIGKGQVMVMCEQPYEAPSYAENRIFYNIRVLPEYERVDDVLDQLYDAVHSRAVEIRKSFSNHKCQLCVGNSVNEIIYNEFALKKGDKEHNSLYFMSAPINLIKQYSYNGEDSAITFREFSLATKEAKEQYLRELEWKCFTDDIMDMQRLLRYMDSDFFMVYGAFDGDKLIGAVMVDQDGDDIPEIESVSVLEQYRGKHYAKIMIGKVMDLLSEKGCEKVKLTVFTSNESAIGLYRNLGFNIDKEEKRFMKYI
ncbi:GNAT family N-acetyltransferase [Clostridium sp. 19966]|uniref:GNAT family N-acetyltransferase n=1 Tax=Clostridium sp. 19966 TaxID=2768166 RepID=UPI0028DD7F8C|nr:GNAT family N-acetyltransferase [Clostridium sp. 19966]MDT8719656.1 GNAT family N-acetyltransferase [Clostridium sp. 19966]